MGSLDVHATTTVLECLNPVSWFLVLVLRGINRFPCVLWFFMGRVIRYFSTRLRRRPLRVTYHVHTAREQSFVRSGLVCERSGFFNSFSLRSPSIAALFAISFRSLSPACLVCKRSFLPPSPLGLRFPVYVSFVAMSHVNPRKSIIALAPVDSTFAAGFLWPASRLPFSVFGFPLYLAFFLRLHR